VLHKKRIDILKPKLPVTHPHPEEFNSFFEFQGAKIVFYLSIPLFYDFVVN